LLYLKAVVAFLVAGLTGVATGLTDDALTQVELVTSIVAAVAAGGAVWRVPNKGQAPVVDPLDEV
jgi:hypothetical protein